MLGLIRKSPYSLELKNSGRRKQKRQPKSENINKSIKRKQNVKNDRRLKLVEVLEII